MSNNPTAQIIAELAAAYEKELPADTLRVYVRELHDIPTIFLSEACRYLARTVDWFPRIAQIRAAVAEHRLALPTEDEALAQIEARIGWYNDWQGQVAPFMHPLVKRALGHVGSTYAFRATNEPAVVRGQFLKLYRDMRNSAIREMQVGDAANQPALTGRPRDALS